MALALVKYKGSPAALLASLPAERGKPWYLQNSRFVDNRCHDVFGQKLLHGKGGVGRRVVMMEGPIAYAPKICRFLPDTLPQSFQNLQVELLVDSLTRENELRVHNTSAIEKANEHCLDV